VLGPRRRHGGDGTPELIGRQLGATEHEQRPAALEDQAICIGPARQNAVDLPQRELRPAGVEQHAGARRADVVGIGPMHARGTELGERRVPLVRQLQDPRAIEMHLRIVGT
jgi:hypothetical protein